MHSHFILLLQTNVYQSEKALTTYENYKNIIAPWIKEVGMDIIMVFIAIFFLNLLWRLFKRMSSIFKTFDAWLGSVKERKERSIILARTSLEFQDKFKQRLEAEKKINEQLHERLVKFQELRAKALEDLDNELVKAINKLEQNNLPQNIRKLRQENIIKNYKSLSNKMNKEFYELDENEFNTFFEHIVNEYTDLSETQKNKANSEK